MTSPPLESEAQARTLPAVEAAYAAADRDRRRGVLGEQNHRLLCAALSSAGVELGHYDHRKVMWVASWEPELAGTIARWIGEAARGREDDGHG